MESGKVIGQLDSITTQSEQGASEALSNLEKSITGVDTMLHKLGEIRAAASLAELETLEKDLLAVQEDLYAVLSAFQFQDISTQKLYKVMSMLGELSDYLNGLLGYPKPCPEPVVAKGIEDVDLVKDKSKSEVDDLVREFQSSKK